MRSARPAARRWRRLVEVRLAEMERLAPGQGGVGSDYWTAARARRYAERTAGSEARDPFLARVRREVDRRTTVLDVGCGPGRFALALAPRAREVVAVEPSPAMLSILRQASRRRGVANIRAVAGRWEDVEVAPVDVALCSYVLPLVADAAGFLAKLDAACRRRAFVYLNAASADYLVDPFWRHFHGRPRCPSPTYLDAVAILEELGIAAEVEVVELAVRTRFVDLADAVRRYREGLLLPRGARLSRELAGLLKPWLVTERDGSLRPPVRTTPAAIVSWGPSS